MMTSMSSDFPIRPLPRRRHGAAARILRDARGRAGLTQRALSARAGVPQETIARIERSVTQPRVDTLALLLDACGLELEAMPRVGIGVDTSLIGSMLDLTPAERLAKGEAAARNTAWLRSARRRPPEPPERSDTSMEPTR